jgi:hypothetical protein
VTPITTLTAPAGTYAISLALTDAVAVQTSGGGFGAEAGCYVDNGPGITLTVPADGTSYDLAGSGVLSITSTTVFTVNCYASFDVRDVIADLTWSELTITATAL